MIRRVRHLVRGQPERPDPVTRLSRADLEARADRIAAGLGVTRERAFEMLSRGELHGKLAEPELYMVRSLLDEPDPPADRRKRLT